MQGNKGKPIKDWKAAVRLWEQNDKKNAPASRSSSGSSIDMDDVDRIMNTGSSFELSDFGPLINNFGNPEVSSA